MFFSFGWQPLITIYCQTGFRKRAIVSGGGEQIQTAYAYITPASAGKQLGRQIVFGVPTRSRPHNEQLVIR